MKNFQKAIAVLALSSMCLAAPVPSENEAPVKKSAKKHHHAAKAEPKKDETAEKLRQLKESVDQQQAATQQLQQQLQQTQQQLQKTQQELTGATQEAEKANAKASEVESNSNLQVQKVQSDLTDVKTAMNTTEEKVQKTEKKVDYLEHPVSISYKGVKLTPGGFLAAESVFRQHAENADIGSYYSGSHFPITGDANTPTYHLTEWRGTARQSRATLLAEGKTGPVKLTGYYEMDFLGAAPTANENQSNSWQPRVRQLFGRVEMHGWSVTGGQTWSLLTLDRKGAEARTEWSPATIDAQYVVGYTWARLMGVRVARTFADDKATVAFSMENPATLFTGTAPGVQILTGAQGVGQLSNGAGSGGGAGTFTTNLAPDLIAKVSFDPGYGHFEIKAVGRFFRDRIGQTSSATGANYTTYGGGIGAGAILPVMPKKVDFIAQGLVGRGTARYGDSSNTANGGDVTYKPNGQLSPIKNLQALAGFEVHPMPKLDVYIYGGDEYLGRNIYGTTSGFGLTNVNVTGCFASSAPPANTTCAPLTKNMLQGSGGFWYNFYKGAYGTLRYGMQYSYTYNNYWRGVNNTPGATATAPKAIENMAFTSLRYYIP